MSEFKSLDATELDPHKRVHYVQGLVLGVDEFKQEQVHFVERDHRHQRALHGYGTVNGLAVSIKENGTEANPDPEVVVSPGLAVDCHGRTICVPTAQCAKLNNWLEQQSELTGADSPAVFAPVYVYACYRECETDLVPIPSGPCKTGDESMQASRITETFRLELSLAPPDQREEVYTSLFGRFLERFVVTEDAGSPSAPFDPEAWFGEDFDLENPPPESPAEPPSSIPIHPDDVEATLKAMLRWWITKVRPSLLGAGCLGGSCDECVLLARLEFDVTDDDPPRVAAGGVTIGEEERPYLLTTRMLQEWARIGAFAFETADSLAGDAAGGDLDGSYPDPTVVGIQGNAVSPQAPQEGEALIWDSAASTWVPQGPPVLDGDAAGSDVTGTFPDELIVSGIRDRPVALPAGAGDMGDVSDGSIIVWRPGSGAAGQWELEMPASAEIPEPGGDVTGDLDDLRVIRLQGRAVTTTRPETGQILVFRRGASPANDQWQVGSMPAVPSASPIVAAGYFDLSAGPDPIGPVLDNMALRRLGGGRFLIQFDSYVRPDPEAPEHTYIVKGTPVEERGRPQGFFRVLHRGDLRPFEGEGILVKIVDTNGQPEFSQGCMIEVTRIPAP